MILPEVVPVSDITDLRVTHHYWKDSEGELWGDFEDPMKNLRTDFAVYLARKHYISPTQITLIRATLNKSVGQLAEMLNLKPSMITQMETNQRIQTDKQERILRAIANQFNVR